MSEKKNETVTVASYLVSKDGKTKYLKFECNPKADPAVKAMVEKIKEAIGGDILFVNLIDEKFRQEYQVPDFVKGRINAPAPTGVSKTKSGKTLVTDEEIPF